MSSKRPISVEDALSDIDNSWEQEIDRLKEEIKRAEERIFISEQSQLAERTKFMRRSDVQGGDSLMSTDPVYVYSSPLVERVIRGRKLSPQADPQLDSRTQVTLSDRKLSKESTGGIWTSSPVPKPTRTKRDFLQDPFSGHLESSFDVDCGSSVISLDFGLVSPHKNWCSPPQRIERAQNREWSSPHRVIDRPNPENSPGNWISMKESCAAPRHSPTLEVQNQPFEMPPLGCPEPPSRPASQSTYVVQEAITCLKLSAKEDQPTNKISVLENYRPERTVCTKKRTGDCSDAVERNLLPSNEKIRKVVTPGGHVVKISLLDDFEAPVFGRTHEKTSEPAEADCGESMDKTTKGTTKRVADISSRSSPSASKSRTRKRKEASKKEDGINTGIQPGNDAGTHLNKKEGEEKTKGKENKTDDVEKSAVKVIHSLEQILRPTKEDIDNTSAPLLNKTKVEETKPKKFKPDAEPTADKTPEAVERRKRIVDAKGVREYIRSQKQKRMEQVKMEKKTKDAEREARKKKLEELRIKTLKLASHSKKKKSSQIPVKVTGGGAEDDVTVSLGLKQVTPKVSYNESISKLRKKTPQQKSHCPPTELEPEENVPEMSEDEKDEGDITLEEVDVIEPEVNRMDDFTLDGLEEGVEMKTESDLNVTLRKLAETLHLKLDRKEKQIRSRSTPLASKSAKEPPPLVQSLETSRTVKSTPEDNRRLITVDMETIKTLKSDIKKISENFKVLHEMIAEKGDLSGKVSHEQCRSSQSPKSPRPAKSNCLEKSSEVPYWPKSLLPKAYPYNVYSAFQKKVNLKSNKALSSVSQGSHKSAKPFAHKLAGEFEGLSVPSDRLCSVKEIVDSFRSTSCGTYEENYFSMRDDSGSELSSSILDSEKQSRDMNKWHFSNSSSRHIGRKDSLSSSIITEITSRSFRMTESRGSCRSVDSGGKDLILVTPDIKLVSTESHQPNSHPGNLHQTAGENVFEELSDSERSCKENTDSTIGELIDNLSERNGSPRNVEQEENRGFVRGVMAQVNSRRSFFQPEMLHLQFQAELTLLETFQQSLSQFLKAERTKALSEGNKVVHEKAVNTEKLLDQEDRSVQASCAKVDSAESPPEETDSVETEISAAESVKSNQADSPKTEQDLLSELTEKLSASSKETLKDDEPKILDNSDFGNDRRGNSLQLLKDTIKDEELRSEHLMALIRLREKTLNEKVKAELTFLEMKKRTLKERGGDEEQNISAIKKKQRGILLKYQSEKEDIDRLKKASESASEDRRAVLKRQKQMQFSDSDVIIRLKKREKSPQKKAPLKPKALNFHQQAECSGDTPIVSDSLFSESICSADESRRSSRSDVVLSSRSNVSKDDRIPVPSSKTTKNKIFSKLENFKSKKSQLEVERYPRSQHSVEELLSWTRRLEEKENHLRELEKQAVSVAAKAKSRLVKSLKNAKTSMKDRSTSPFQIQDGVKTPSELSPPEATETKKSTTTISEAIDANTKTEGTEKTESVAEKLQSSATEDIPEQLSKKISTSRSTEYQSESFESPTSSETNKNKPEVSRKWEWGHKSIAIKMSLSPRMQSPRRRYSSGSDDSVNLSHTETASEHSDLESRIAALHEELQKRKLEAERLRREQKKAQRERLRVKEQCLLNQIQAYDAYIQKKKQELEREYEYSSQTIMKPLIKQPKVAEKPKGDSAVSLQNEKPVSHGRVERKAVEKEEETPEKESDSEVLEQIKPESIKEAADDSDSIKEQIESKLEEGKEFKATEYSIRSLRESFEGGKSTSVSESLPEQDPQEGSQSDSEDPSMSIKTTLQSPERQETDANRTPTATAETTRDKQATDEEDSYRLDSFESDADEETTGREVVEEVSERSEGRTEVNEDEENANADSDREEENLENSGKAEKIADSIIAGLILESVNVFCSKKAEVEKKLAEESRLSLETLSNFLAMEIMSEAVEDMITIYNRKTSPGKRGTPRPVASEVRRRITEIMSQAGGARCQRKPQEILITTFDVSPPDEAAAEGAERERFLQSLAPPKKEKPEEQAFTDEECEGQEPKPETFGQEWIDDDFGLSQSRKEAEELRLQQLQIEQEIQQLQAQQKQVPYFYLREIPNKPPPPYTPPAKPFAEIPASEAEISRITLNAVRILTDEMKKGNLIADVEPDSEYYGDAASENFKCYKLFLFDLAKHIISELLDQQQRKEEVLPWMRTRKRLSRYRYQKVERTFGCLNDFVQRQVFVLFGFGRKVSKESLIVKWIKKKRDHVDEILVGESQEEESQWTQYDEDQIAVKNEVALGILDGLLEDTAQVVSSIFRGKMKKGERNGFALSQ